jgi:hypothetical protein
MKKRILMLIIGLLITSPVVAWDDNYNDESFLHKQERKREQERNKEYPYESSSGTRYKYDLSKPGDQLRYEVDPGAQIRDSVNPRVEIDRGLEQYGGGSE